MEKLLSERPFGLAPPLKPRLPTLCSTSGSSHCPQDRLWPNNLLEMQQRSKGIAVCRKSPWFCEVRKRDCTSSALKLLVCLFISLILSSLGLSYISVVLGRM